MVYMDGSATSSPFTWESLVQIYRDRPLHWFFLFHPLLFAGIFFLFGTLLDRFENRTDAAWLRMEAEARTDGLTRLLNHSAFYQILGKELERFHRTWQKKPNHANLSLVMLDLDGFKKINDTYGHLQGDEVLIQFARILQKNTRPYDSVCRYGGDEFTLILPETTGGDAERIAARTLRQARQEIRVGGIPVTISIGIVWLQGAKPVILDASELVAKADQALYQAKHEGRNCIRMIPLASEPSAAPAPMSTSNPEKS